MINSKLSIYVCTLELTHCSCTNAENTCYLFEWTYNVAFMIHFTLSNKVFNIILE